MIVAENRHGIAKANRWKGGLFFCFFLAFGECLFGGGRRFESLHWPGRATLGDDAAAKSRPDFEIRNLFGDDIRIAGGAGFEAIDRSRQRVDLISNPSSKSRN